MKSMTWFRLPSEPKPHTVSNEGSTLTNDPIGRFRPRAMSFEDACREWEDEVKAEAERLVKLGVPPWDAIIQARQRIERKRRGAREGGAALRR